MTRPAPFKFARTSTMGDESKFSAIFELCEIKKDVFQNKEPLCGIRSDTARATFGGHLLSLGVKAALLTIPTTSDWLINSVHCNYIRPGRPDEPVIYEVYNKKDGQILSHRSVAAKQNGRIVITCSVSFKLPHKEGADLPYNEETLSTSLPGPDDTKVNYVPAHSILTKNIVKFPFQFRFYPPGYCNKQNTGATNSLLPKELCWIKPKDALSRDAHQNEHRVAMISASDCFLPGMVLNQYPDYPYTLTTSLDHAVWFEDDNVDINKWHLFNIKCLSSNNGGTSLNISKIYSEDGTLVATAVQQGYIRGPKL